jgi:cyclophilin family peptidyl-prolyl cis-trans isomerase
MSWPLKGESRGRDEDVDGRDQDRARPGEGPDLDGELHRVRERQVLRQDGVSSRHPGVHDPGRWLRQGHEPEEDQGADQERGRNGLKNVNGTIAMARTSDPNSATAQFFFNTKDNVFLDHRDDSVQGYGYAVFGKVVGGMDVVQKIEAVQTTTKMPHQNVPVTPVVIESVVVEKK